MITDTLTGATISVSHRLTPELRRGTASPRIMVEIEEGEAIDAKAKHLASLGLAARVMTAEIAAAASDNLPVEVT